MGLPSLRALHNVLWGGPRSAALPRRLYELHATAKCDTGGGAISILLALAIASNFPVTGKLKFLVIAFMIAMINPMVSHAIARAAYKSGGVKPKAVVDMYAWDNP